MTALIGGMLATSAATATAAADGARATATEPAAVGMAKRRPMTRTALARTRQVTMNVKFGMTPAQHRRDIQRTTHRADVIGWQEIIRASQTRVIRNLKSWGTYWPGGKRRDGRVWRSSVNTAPISWRKGTWRFVRGGTRLASHEIPDVCRARHLTFVVLRHRASGAKIVRWNVHFVSNALNKNPVRRKAARRAAWYRAADTVQRFLDDMAGRGFAAVIGGGDINSWYVDFAGDRVSYDTDHLGVDYLTHIPGYRVRAAEPQFAGMHSDHDRVRVVYTMYR